MDPQGRKNTSQRPHKCLILVKCRKNFTPIKIMIKIRVKYSVLHCYPQPISRSTPSFLKSLLSKEKPPLTLFQTTFKTSYTHAPS